MQIWTGCFDFFLIFFVNKAFEAFFKHYAGNVHKIYAIRSRKWYTVLRFAFFFIAFLGTIYFELPCYTHPRAVLC